MRPSSWTVNSTSSPSLMCSARLIESGRVSCPFGRSLARALSRGSASLSLPVSFTVSPPGTRYWESTIFSNIFWTEIRLRGQASELLGQPRTREIRIIYQFHGVSLALLSNGTPIADVAGAVAEALAEDVAEVRHRRKAAPRSDVGHGLRLFGGSHAEQHRVGKV